MLNIVLYQPEIPQNTGNIARTCVATGAQLHLIHPLGFEISERTVRRAGLDYWDRLKLHHWETLEDFFTSTPVKHCWYVETRIGRSYDLPDYPEEIYFFFGRESTGLPQNLMDEAPEQTIHIPMTKNNRSLNLSNSVAIIAYEYLRQTGFAFNL